MASTKAFTAQVSVLYLLALKLADSNDTINRNAMKAVEFDDGINKIKSILKKKTKLRKLL